MGICNINVMKLDFSFVLCSGPIHTKMKFAIVFVVRSLPQLLCMCFVTDVLIEVFLNFMAISVPSAGNHRKLRFLVVAKRNNCTLYHLSSSLFRRTTESLSC